MKELLSKLKFLDFFSGIGGFRLGFEMAGHECVGHVEWDKYAQKSYTAMHNVKEDEYVGWDIRGVQGSDLPRADCWTFGFPCQDISLAGKQFGLSGERSGLFFSITKLIRDSKEENKPSYLLIENVKNLLSVNRGIDFARLLIELDEIGYDTEWCVLDSKNFGVPQNRERIYIIGHFRGRGGRKVFPIEYNVNSNKILQIAEYDTKRINSNAYRVYNSNGVAPTLTTTQGGGRQPHILVSGRIRRLSPKEYFRLQGFPDEYFNRAKNAGVSDSQLYKQSGNSVSVPVIYEIARRLSKGEKFSFND